MAFRNHDDDYGWILERNLRSRSTLAQEEDGPQPKLADTLIDLATVVAGFAGVILLIDAAVTALR